MFSTVRVSGPYRRPMTHLYTSHDPSLKLEVPRTGGEHPGPAGRGTLPAATDPWTDPTPNSAAIRVPRARNSRNTLY